MTPPCAAGVRPAIVSTSGSTLSKIFLDRPMDYYILDSVDEVNARAEQLLREDEHDLLLVYNGNYDAAMHRYAPESPEALRALRANAEAFAQLASIARRHWSGYDSLLAFAPDHGCHEIEGGLGTHGLDAETDMLLPHFYGAWPRHALSPRPQKTPGFPTACTGVGEAGLFFLFLAHLVARAVREEDAIRQPDAEDAGIHVLEVVVPVVDPRGERGPQLLRDGGVFRTAEVPGGSRPRRGR